MIEINGKKKQLSELTAKEWGLVIFGLLLSFAVVGGISLMLVPFFFVIGGFLLVVLAFALLGGIISGVGSLIKSLWYD